MNYRLQIHRDGAHWGHFDCSGPDALQRMDAIAAQLPADQGFQLKRGSRCGMLRCRAVVPRGGSRRDGCGRVRSHG